VNLTGGDRSTRSWPWQRKAGDAELVRVRRSSTCPGVGSTCSAATWGSQGGSYWVLRCGGTTTTGEWR
jgi:hypothetical protein